MNLAVATCAYGLSAIGAALFGDSSVVVDVLAGGGLGALIAQVVILRRARQGVHGREAQIVAAWSAFLAALSLIAIAASELL